ncbi:retrovirus-related pol polyprotein from transposon TNT 1-94 [Tanacetum coccineum]
MASMNTRLNIEKLDGNIVQKHGGSKQVGFKQLGPGVETGVYGVHDEKRVWFEVELQRAQGNLSCCAVGGLDQRNKEQWDVCVYFSNAMEVPRLHVLDYRLPLSMKSQPLSKDLVQGNVTIKRVYYVEALNHNLFSVGQFSDAHLEVTFRIYTSFVRDLQGNDLLTGTRGFDLYIIALQEAFSPTLICFMAKASPTQAWLWHHRLSHRNFKTINLLSKNDIVNGLPKLKFVKDQVCSSCEMGKEKSAPSRKKLFQVLKDGYICFIWTYVVTYHRLEQVHENPSKLVQIRQQLATDTEMCMFMLTVSIAEPKAMADHAWIKAMQEELHQFDRLKPDGFVDPDHPEKVYHIRKELYGLKLAPRALFDELLTFLISKGFTKGTIDVTPRQRRNAKRNERDLHNTLILMCRRVVYNK